MGHVGTVLVPLYRVAERYPAFEHALWLGTEFRWRVLLVEVIRRHQFVRLTGSPPIAGPVGYIDDGAVSTFRKGIRRTSKRLAESAESLGVPTERTTVETGDTAPLRMLTRRVELVATQLERTPVLCQLVFGDGDWLLHKRAHCPILVTRGAPLSTGPAVVVYDRTARANRGLRWLARFREAVGVESTTYVVVAKRLEERERLETEIRSMIRPASGRYAFCAATPGQCLARTAEVVGRLQSQLVAMPSYAFHGRFTLRGSGIPARTYDDLNTHVLLFP